MALERQSIEKTDFPIGRRGYDPDAVDQHLNRLADKIEELKRSSRRRGETLASSASEQVRAIVEAAETSAAEIQRRAEDDAREIKAEAADEASATRELANTQAREYISKVSESTAVMLQRLDAMESELGALIESLRTGSNRLNADLQLLEGNLSDVTDAVAPRPRFEPEAVPVAAPLAPPPIDDPLIPAVPPELDALAPPEPLAPPATPEPVPAPPPVTVPPLDEPEAFDRPAFDDELPEADYRTSEIDRLAPTGGFDEGSDDSEGARLIALNMALNGTPREETERYLAENFQLSDRGLLLDEVYSSVEG